MKVVQATTDHRLSVADQALRWFVRLRSGDATVADHWQFQSWVKSASSHQQEFEKVSRLWTDLDETKPLLIEELNRVVVDGKPQPHLSRERHVGRWLRRRGLSTALAALLVLFIAGGWWVANRPEVTEYRTAKGEQRTIALPDGSRMVLNTDTAVTTHLSTFRRAVILHRGEAFFVVSHDKKRSFEVEAGSGVVRDIGTQFTVRRQSEQVTVIVVEGAVEVQGLSETDIAPWRLLTAGDKASYGARGSISPIEKIDIAASTAWLEGRMLFDQRPLAEVIQEVGRYHNGEIRVLDSRLNGIKVSGVFAVNDREGLLKALETAIPVNFSRINEGLVVLEQKKITSAKR